MPAPKTVRADGLVWPLRTFISAYRMIVTDGSPPDFRNLDPAVSVLMENGSFVKRQPASLVEWHHVHAFACEALPKGLRCDTCGDHTDLAELLKHEASCEDCGNVELSMSDFLE